MAFLSDIICKYEDEANTRIKEARASNRQNAPKESIFFESPRLKEARASGSTVKSYSTSGTGGGTDGIFLNSPIPACVNNSQATAVPRLERKFSNKTGMAAIAEEAMYISREIKKERDAKWKAIQEGAYEDTQATKIAEPQDSNADKLKKENEELRTKLAQLQNNQ